MDRKISNKIMLQTLSNQFLNTGRSRNYRRIEHPLIRELQRSSNNFLSFHQKEKPKQFHIHYTKTPFKSIHKHEETNQQRKKHMGSLNINNLSLATKLNYSRHYQPHHTKQTSQYYLDSLNNIPIRISTQNPNAFQSQENFQKIQNTNRKKKSNNRRYYQAASDSHIANYKYESQKGLIKNRYLTKQKNRIKASNSLLLRNTQTSYQVQGWEKYNNDDAEELINI